MKPEKKAELLNIVTALVAGCLYVKHHVHTTTPGFQAKDQAKTAIEQARQLVEALVGAKLLVLEGDDA